MSYSSRLGRAAIASALACGALFGVAVPAHAGIARTCTTYHLPVRIADPGPADQTMWGELCYPGSTRPDTVQLLVHGATYNHLYWDFPVGNGYYSYVDAALAAGYATFNVDRIGAGNSSHPPSAQLNLPAGAVSLHDAITALRSGTLDGHAFSHVAWIAHSLGTFLAWYEISRYHDVDAAIFTSGLHAGNPQGGTILYPAVQDPKFANSGLDSGYVTTIPGDRNFFYYPATADPAVIAADEANKDVATLTPGPAPPDPLDITVPVLLVVGQKDQALCVNVTVYDCANPPSILAFESQFYMPQAQLSLQMIPGTGHDLALSTTAPLTDAIMLGWLGTHLG